MKLVDIITQAQTIAGLNDLTGNTLDVNQMATGIAIFHQTLNAINNDPKLNLIQSVWDYQRDSEVNGDLTQSNMPGGSYIDIPQLQPDDEEESDDKNDIKLKFPDYTTPFPVSKTYPLPMDARRVLKVMSGNTELRKTDYSEIKRNQSVHAMSNLYSVNERKLELIFPACALLVYVKEFPEFMPQDEVTLPLESLDYVINTLAYNLALCFNSPRVGMLQVLSEKSYNALLGNVRANEGSKYQSVYTAFNRFGGYGGHIH